MNKNSKPEGPVYYCDGTHAEKDEYAGRRRSHQNSSVIGSEMWNTSMNWRILAVIWRTPILDYLGDMPK